MKTSRIAGVALACASIAAAAAAQGLLPIAAPLPEADAYGTMLAGLCCLALLGRRRGTPTLPYTRLSRLLHDGGVGHGGSPADSTASG